MEHAVYVIHPLFVGIANNTKLCSLTHPLVESQAQFFATPPINTLAFLTFYVTARKPEKFASLFSRFFYLNTFIVLPVFDCCRVWAVWSVVLACLYDVPDMASLVSRNICRRERSSYYTVCTHPKI